SAAGGAVLVAAMVAGVLVLAPSGRHHGSVRAGDQSSSVRSQATARPATIAPGQLRSREAAAAAAAMSAAARSAVAAEKSQLTAPPSRKLVTVATPQSAEVAIGLAPEGWRYTGQDPAQSFYGPNSLARTDTPDFATVIVVDVHERMQPDG